MFTPFAPTVPPPPPAGRRAWLGLAVIALPCVVYAMDLSALNLALPAISADLHPSSAQLLWIVDIYGFLVAGALITMGALGDRIGARRLLMIGAVAFTGASLIAAVAPTAGTLIAARALLGLAGATLAPSTLSLIRALFDDERRRRTAIGVWATSYSVGAALGPLAGGAVLQAGSWRAIFLLAVPVMLLLVLVGPRVLPEQRDPAPGRIDLASAALSLAAVLVAVYGLKQLATGGGALVGAGAILGGLALGLVFVRRQDRLAEPLIDLRLFRVPVFSAALGTNLVAFFVIFGMALFFTQYLQSVVGLSALAAGAWSVPEALGFVVGAMVAPPLAERLSPASLIGGGMAVGAVGYALVATVDGTVAPLVAGSTLGAVGIGVVVTLVADIAVGVVPADRAGIASATSETSSELGGALGIAVLGSLGAAVYRVGLPGDAPAQARDTLGGALATGDGLTRDAAAQLAAGARDAFTHALTVTASVAAALLLLGGAGGLVLLRRAAALPAPSATTPRPPPASSTRWPTTSRGGEAPACTGRSGDYRGESIMR